MATKQGKEGNSINVQFTLDKETKGALRYAEVNGEGKQVEIADGAKVGTLYIRKSAFPGGVTPRALNVVVTF